MNKIWRFIFMSATYFVAKHLPLSYIRINLVYEKTYLPYPFSHGNTFTLLHKKTTLLRIAAANRDHRTKKWRGLAIAYNKEHHY